MNLKQLLPDVKEAYDCSCVLPRYVLNQPQQSPRYCISREKVQRRRLVMFLLRSDCVVFCFCEETVPSVKWRQGHRRIAPASLYCVVSLMKSACNDGNWPPPKNASDSASPSGSSVRPCTNKRRALFALGNADTPAIHICFPQKLPRPAHNSLQC